jgi:hypothetical protein
VNTYDTLRIPLVEAEKLQHFCTMCLVVEGRDEVTLRGFVTDG